MPDAGFWILDTGCSISDGVRDLDGDAGEEEEEEEEEEGEEDEEEEQEARACWTNWLKRVSSPS